MTSNTQATTLNPKLSMKLEGQNSLDTLGLDSVEVPAPLRKHDTKRSDGSSAEALEIEDQQRINEPSAVSSRSYACACGPKHGEEE